MTHGPEKSDLSTVAMKLANKTGQPEAESVERRERAEGNTEGQHMRRTQSRESVSQGLERVREAAPQKKKERFTALLHYVTINRLTDAFSSLKREAAPGVDGATWQSYKQDLEINLMRLHEQVHRGTYRRV
jgi:RNA-directed DNA polymerase